MIRRRLRIFLFLCALGSLGASHRTAHFVVEAPDEEVARKVGEKAERCRKQLALKWLVAELPDGEEPCLVEVVLTAKSCRGGHDHGIPERGNSLDTNAHGRTSRRPVAERRAA